MNDSDPHDPASLPSDLNFLKSIVTTMKLIPDAGRGDLFTSLSSILSLGFDRKTIADYLSGLAAVSDESAVLDTLLMEMGTSDLPSSITVGSGQEALLDRARARSAALTMVNTLSQRYEAVIEEAEAFERFARACLAFEDSQQKRSIVSSRSPQQELAMIDNIERWRALPVDESLSERIALEESTLETLRLGNHVDDAIGSVSETERTLVLAHIHVSVRTLRQTLWRFRGQRFFTWLRSTTLRAAWGILVLTLGVNVIIQEAKLEFGMATALGAALWILSEMFLQPRIAIWLGRARYHYLETMSSEYVSKRISLVFQELRHANTFDRLTRKSATRR